MQVAGDGVGSSSNVALRRSSPPTPTLSAPQAPPARAVDAARAEAANAVSASAASPVKATLAQTAAGGRPVEAGSALRQLDQQNGGNRAATNEQVGFASMKPLFLGGTALGSNIAPTKVSIDGTVDKDGERTATKGMVQTKLLNEGNTTNSLTEKTETKTSFGSWSVTKTITDQTNSKIFDNLGRPIDPDTGKTATLVDSKLESSAGLKVDKDSLSATVEVNGEKNGVKSNYTTTTKIDENGLSQSKSVEVGQAKVSGGGAFKIDENGNVTASGTAGLNLGPVGAQVKAETVNGPNGTKDTTVTSFTVKTPDGKPVSAKVEYKITDSEELSKNEDGSTTFKLTGETKFTVAGGVDVKKVSVDGSWFNGQRTIHTVTIPEKGLKNFDIKTLDPSKPETWPEGTRVMIKSEDFNGSSLGVAYANFGVEGSAETREGTSIVMEKQAGGQLSVATGPTVGFTNSGKMKVDIGAGFGVELGAENKVDFAFYKTFNIDLGATGGGEIFTNVFAGGKAPNVDGNGVSNLMDTTYGDWNYTGSAKLSTPFGSWGPEHKEGSKSIWKTYADGRVEYSRTYDANGDGKGELTKTAISTDGKTWKDEVYTLTVEVTTEKDSQLHNAQQMTANENLKVGDKIEVRLTAEEIEALRQKQQSFYSWEPESADVKASMNDSFADYLARQNGVEGILTELFTLKHANNVGDYTSELPQFDPDHPLPGEVTIIVK